MREITWVDRFRYRFDAVMSRGSTALILWLFILSLALIALVTCFVGLTNSAPAAEDGAALDFGDVFWMSLLRTLDSGTMGGDHGNPLFLGAMLFITLAGIFVVSTLIGILTTGIDQRLEELRKGRSFVVEKGHSLILGWSPQIFTVISELVVANANKKDGCIVILAEKDKVEMEDEIRSKVGDTGVTRIVCRTGSTIDLGDLEIVNPDHARSIIVLCPDGENPDMHVIKTLLALVNNTKRKSEPYHIVAELREPANMEAARMVGKDEVEIVLAGDLIARLAVQTCRQSGLSVVYNELLDFDGDEIYFQEEPKLAGRTFGDTLSAFEESCVIGLRKKDGSILLNPAMVTKIESGDRIIAIARDDDAIQLSPRSSPPPDESAIQSVPPQPPSPERTLILGWNERIPLIIRELDSYVTAGSEVTVVADVIGAQRELGVHCQGLVNQKLNFVFGDTTNRSALFSLDVHGYHHILVASYTERFGIQEADARTLITLLHLRSIAEHHGHHYSVVSEMLDVRNRELAKVTQADDFIVSHKFVSLLLSQISQNKELSLVFADLFRSEGSEIYLKPADNFVKLDTPVNFYTIVEAARRRSEVAIGYRLRAEANDASKAYGVRVNPKKSDTITLGAHDKVIVLAEN